MARALALAVAFAICVAPMLANAQSPVVTIPTPATTSGGNASSTIASTNTFQKVFGATASSPGSTTRKGCTIVPQGSNTMWVTEGLGVAGSTKAAAVQLVPGQAYFCQKSGVVLVGEIDITGTSGDAFYAAQY